MPANRPPQMRLTYQGITDTLSGWAARTGLNLYTIKARLRNHWTVKDTLTDPPGPSAKAANRAKFDLHKEFDLAKFKAESREMAAQRRAQAARSAGVAYRTERDQLYYRAARIHAHRERHSERLSEPRRLLLFAAELRLLMAAHPPLERKYSPRIRALCQRARRVWVFERAERRSAL